MIPFASQRGGGQDFATHLQNEYDNEIMEVVEVRGAISQDLHGAFKEWEVQAETLTRCRKYLYSLSINPDPEQGELTRAQYMDYIARAETALGLASQPRAIVFHTKHDREHCHVVWSRIDADRQKAVHIAFDRETLMQVTREFARKNFLDLPAGYDKRGHSPGQDTLYERAQQNETGLSKADHMQRVTAAWQHSDSAKSFVQALAEQGYVLARGRRPYVLVDIYGGQHALSKLIDDKSVKTKELHTFLAKDFPEESLPSVEEAEALAEKHRKLREKAHNEDRLALKLEQLKRGQQLRRLAVEQQRQALRASHQGELEAQQRLQREERRQLIDRQVAAKGDVRRNRADVRPSGLVGFLGKITGVTAIRRAVHRYQDMKLADAHYKERGDLSRQQESQRQVIAVRQKLEACEIERKSRAVSRLEAREIASLRRDDLRDQRVRERGADRAMPPIEHALNERPAPDLLTAFNQTNDQKERDIPDLRVAFRDAASDRAQDQSGDDERGQGPEQEPERNGPDRNR